MEPQPATVLPPTALPAGLTAARVAREHVDRLCSAVPRPLLEQARLLTSELVSNAALHGIAPVLLSIRCDARQVRVEVSDGDPTLPRPPAGPPGHADSGGRGLFLLVSIASAWGTGRGPGGRGKTVWFELRATG